MNHGTSGNGNDHIHLAVSLVREDETTASTHDNYKPAQGTCRELEVNYGLEQLSTVHATRGYDRAENGTLPTRTWVEYTRNAAAVADQLRSIPRDDHATWAKVAREVSGAFAARKRRAKLANPQLAQSLQTAHTAKTSEAALEAADATVQERLFLTGKDGITRSGHSHNYSVNDYLFHEHSQAGSCAQPSGVDRTSSAASTSHFRA